METKEEKESTVATRFSSVKVEDLGVYVRSYWYKHYEQTINEMLENKSLQFLKKVRNVVYLKYNHCYTMDVGIKAVRCAEQCAFCLNLQKQREIYLEAKNDRAARRFEANKNPGKLNQLVKIISLKLWKKLFN